jgi:hypothetical protein
LRILSRSKVKNKNEETPMKSLLRMSLRGEFHDRREWNSTKQSLQTKLNLNGLLRRSFVAPRNDDF